MNSRWLAIVACLLLVACNNNEDVADNNDASTTKQMPDISIDADADNNTSKKAINEKASDTDAEPGDEANSSAELTDAEKLANAEGKYQAAMKAFRDDYSAAKTDEEKQQVASESYPDARDYADEIFAIANASKDKAVTFKALSFIANNVRNGAEHDEAMNLLFANHIENAEMKQHGMMLGYGTPGEKTEQRLNRLINDSPHATVKGLATFAKGSYLRRILSAKKRLEDESLPSHYDQATDDFIRDKNIDQASVEAIYQSVIDDYPDVKPREQSKQTLGQMAERTLFEMRNLVVGKIAPDIEGEDLDGESFKLSDYRGKVVVIDFWGDW